ncbi:MAG: hypothetical protein MHPSP_001563, partial [Paramarteilia canceri]
YGDGNEQSSKDQTDEGQPEKIFFQSLLMPLSHLRYQSFFETLYFGLSFWMCFTLRESFVSIPDGKFIHFEGFNLCKNVIKSSLDPKFLERTDFWLIDYIK